MIVVEFFVPQRELETKEVDDVFCVLEEKVAKWTTRLSDAMGYIDIQNVLQPTEQYVMRMRRVIASTESNTTSINSGACREELAQHNHALLRHLQEVMKRLKDNLPLQDVLARTGYTGLSEESESDDVFETLNSPSHDDLPSTSNAHRTVEADPRASGAQNGQSVRSGSENRSDEHFQSDAVLPSFVKVTEQVEKNKVWGKKSRRKWNRPRARTNQQTQPNSSIHVTVHPGQPYQRVNIKFEKGVSQLSPSDTPIPTAGSSQRPSTRSSHFSTQPTREMRHQEPSEHSVATPTSQPIDPGSNIQMGAVVPRTNNSTHSQRITINSAFRAWEIRMDDAPRQRGSQDFISQICAPPLQFDQSVGLTSLKIITNCINGGSFTPAIRFHEEWHDLNKQEYNTKGTDQKETDHSGPTTGGPKQSLSDGTRVNSEQPIAGIDLTSRSTACPTSQHADTPDDLVMPSDGDPISSNNQTPESVDNDAVAHCESNLFGQPVWLECAPAAPKETDDTSATLERPGRSNDLTEPSPIQSDIDSRRSRFLCRISNLQSNPTAASEVLTIDLDGVEQTSDAPCSFDDVERGETGILTGDSSASNENAAPRTQDHSPQRENTREIVEHSSRGEILTPTQNIGPSSQRPRHGQESGQYNGYGHTSVPDSFLTQAPDGSYNLDARVILQMMRGTSTNFEFYKGETGNWEFRCDQRGENDESIRHPNASVASSQNPNGNLSRNGNLRNARNTPARHHQNPYENVNTTDLPDNLENWSASQAAMVFPQRFKDKFLSGMNSLVVLEKEGLLLALDLKNSFLKLFLVYEFGNKPKAVSQGLLVFEEQHQPYFMCKLCDSRVAVARKDKVLTVVSCNRSRQNPELEFEVDCQRQYSTMAYVRDGVLACSCYSQRRIDVVKITDETIETLTVVKDREHFRPEALCFMSQFRRIVFLEKSSTLGSRIVGVTESGEVVFEESFDDNPIHSWNITHHGDRIVACCKNTNQFRLLRPDGTGRGEISFPEHALDHPFGLFFDIKGRLFVTNEGVPHNGVPPFTKPDIRIFRIS